MWRQSIPLITLKRLKFQTQKSIQLGSNWPQKVKRHLETKWKKKKMKSCRCCTGALQGFLHATVKDLCSYVLQILVLLKMFFISLFSVLAGKELIKTLPQMTSFPGFGVLPNSLITKSMKNCLFNFIWTRRMLKMCYWNDQVLALFKRKPWQILWIAKKIVNRCPFPNIWKAQKYATSTKS